MSFLQTLRTLGELFDFVPTKPASSSVQEEVVIALPSVKDALSPEIQAAANSLGLEFQVHGEKIFFFIRSTPENKYIDGPFTEIDLQVQESRGAKNVRIISFICTSIWTNEVITYRVFEIPQHDGSRMIKVQWLVEEGKLEELWSFSLCSVKTKSPIKILPPLALDHTVYEARPSDVFDRFKQAQRSV